MAQEIAVVDQSLDFLVSAWLDEVGRRSGSSATLTRYASNILSFRTALHSCGLDLDSNPPNVAAIAQAWAQLAVRKEKVSANTFNQRIASISSFYAFALRRWALKYNPMTMVERQTVYVYSNATPLPVGRVQAALYSIDRAKPQGKRDYALLLVALTTGRRLSEIARLCWEDVSEEGKVTFKRAKGGKVMRDSLSSAVLAALRDYRSILPVTAQEGRIWRSFHGTEHLPLSIKALERISEKYLGTSKFHALRHTFAHSMEQVGAKVSDIQARLGHTSMSTTGLYLSALGADTNPFADTLANLFVGN